MAVDRRAVTGQRAGTEGRRRMRRLAILGALVAACSGATHSTDRLDHPAARPCADPHRDCTRAGRLAECWGTRTGRITLTCPSGGGTMQGYSFQAPIRWRTARSPRRLHGETGTHIAWSIARRGDLACCWSLMTNSILSRTSSTARRCSTDARVPVKHDGQERGHSPGPPANSNLSTLLHGPGSSFATCYDRLGLMRTRGTPRPDEGR